MLGHRLNVIRNFTWSCWNWISPPQSSFCALRWQVAKRQDQRRKIRWPRIPSKTKRGYDKVDKEEVSNTFLLLVRHSSGPPLFLTCYHIAPNYCCCKIWRVRGILKEQHVSFIRSFVHVFASSSSYCHTQTLFVGSYLLHPVLSSPIIYWQYRKWFDSIFDWLLSFLPRFLSFAPQKEKKYETNAKGKAAERCVLIYLWPK